MEAAKEEEIHGYKLVHRGTYEPFYQARHFARPAPQRYVPGTTQWIDWNDYGGKYLPPALKLCSSSALHFCRRAVECCAFKSHGLDISDMTLLRVTPVRWPTASADATPFIEETDASEPAKCGAYGLRVDGEVIDAAELSALLSGVLETESRPYGKNIRTFADGRLTKHQHLDALGNCVLEWMTGAAGHKLFKYACLVRRQSNNDVDLASPNVVSTSASVLNLVRNAADNPWWTTVVYGDPSTFSALHVLKSYSRVEITSLVGAVNGGESA